MTLALSWPLQLTYPFQRWPIGKSYWPSVYKLDDKELREKLFEAILAEGNVTAGCRSVGIHRSNVYRYAIRNEEFRKEFDAISDYVDRASADDAIRIADEATDPLQAPLVRIQVDARVRIAALRAGVRRSSVEVNVDNRKVEIHASDEEQQKWIEARERALAIQDKKKESE